MQTTARSTPKRWPRIVVAVLAVAIVSMGGLFWFNRNADVDRPGYWSAATRKNIDELHLAAQKYISSDDPFKAKLILEKLLHEHPDDAVGEVLMAKALTAENHAQAAYEHIIRSLELDGSRDEIQFFAGNLADQIGKPDLAGYHYGRAAALAPKVGQYPMYLAQLEIKKKNYDNAEALLLRAKFLDSSLSQVYSMLAEIASQEGKRDMALDQIDKAISQVQPGDPKFLAYTLQKSQLLRRDNQPDAALRDLLALEPKLQQQAPTVEQIALCYRMLSKPARAAAVWAMLFASDPTNQNAAVETGDCLFRAGDIEHARQYYEYARALGTDNPKVKALAAALQSTGKSKGK